MRLQHRNHGSELDHTGDPSYRNLGSSGYRDSSQGNYQDYQHSEGEEANKVGRETEKRRQNERANPFGIKK